VLWYGIGPVREGRARNKIAQAPVRIRTPPAQADSISRTPADSSRERKGEDFKSGTDRKAEHRNACHKVLVGEATRNGCWVITSPGAPEVHPETLPGSRWPDALRERGYRLRSEPDGERMPFEVREVMTQNSNSTLGILTPGSTQATTIVVHHAGIVRTKRYSFLAP
jgi:hypothetical protein